jgi:acetyl esterase/lipase
MTTPEYTGTWLVDRDLRAAFRKLTGTRGPLRPDMLEQRRREAARSAPPRAWLQQRTTIGRQTAPATASRPPLELMVLRPHDVDGIAGCIYFMHSGGMVLGNNRFGAEAALEWARAFGAVVVSPEYRLAPEHPHPAPVEDCYAGLLFTVGHARELAIDPDRVVVAGSSAGGGLAAAMTLMARDRNGPRLAGQLLVCPMLDDRTPSTVWPASLEHIGTWDTATNAMAWAALLGEQAGASEVSCYAAPARAEDLSSLPPAYVDVGALELFRNPAVDYACRMWQVGGSAELHIWPGAFHGSDRIVPEARVSRAARGARADWLTRLARSL